MKNKVLLAKVNNIVSICFEQGSIIQVTPSVSKNTFILSNRNNQKIIMIGMLTNKEGDSIIGACDVNVSKFLWASTEGFSIDDMFREAGLYTDIFNLIPVENAIELLA
tara:strand:- start:2661 stop:2984 length:324 start_codon:yes stop_codon:yes gene_type:complete